jgi:hypothetical protein
MPPAPPLHGTWRDGEEAPGAGIVGGEKVANGTSGILPSRAPRRVLLNAGRDGEVAAAVGRIRRRRRGGGEEGTAVRARRGEREVGGGANGGLPRLRRRRAGSAADEGGGGELERHLGDEGWGSVQSD